MITLIEGTMRVFGNNIDTDQIVPGRYLELTDPQAIAAHCLEGADPKFPQRYSKGNIITAGTNFGCGSSREHAAIALKTLGVGAVIAKSFARIFYRNGINLGLPLIICPKIDLIAQEGAPLLINLADNIACNRENKISTPTEIIPEYIMRIFAAGGIKALLQKEEAAI